MQHIWGTGEVFNRVLVGKLWGKRPGVDGRIILKWILKKYSGIV